MNLSWQVNSCEIYCEGAARMADELTFSNIFQVQIVAFAVPTGVNISGK